MSVPKSHLYEVVLETEENEFSNCLARVMITMHKREIIDLHDCDFAEFQEKFHIFLKSQPFYNELSELRKSLIVQTSLQTACFTIDFLLS